MRDFVFIQLFCFGVMGAIIYIYRHFGFDLDLLTIKHLLQLLMTFILIGNCMKFLWPV